MRGGAARTKDKDGYDAVQLGLVEFIKPQRVNKPMTGHFKKAGVAPMRYVREMRIEDSKDETKAGDRVLVDGFKVGEYVDVSGVSKGKGFQGGVKRWHYRGGDAIARLDVPSRARRNRREFVSFARVEGAALSRAHGQRAQNVEEFARRENRRGGEFAAGARRRSRPGRQLHFYSQGQSKASGKVNIERESERRRCPLWT